MKLFNNRFISTALLTTAVTTASVVLAAPARAFEFGTRFIRFSEDTTLEFEFLGGSGKYVSNGWLDFGVAKSQDNLEVVFDSLIDSGRAFVGEDVGTTASYLFEADTKYRFYLSNDEKGTTYFSKNLWNPDDENHAKFISKNPFADGGALIDWEDLAYDPATGKVGDGDYNDYKIRATAVPAPAAVLPILTGLFGVASKRNKSEEEA